MISFYYVLKHEVFQVFEMRKETTGSVVRRIPILTLTATIRSFLVKTCLRVTLLLLGLSCLGLLEERSVLAASSARTDHVLLFVLEGVGNDVIQNGDMPVLQKLANEGAVTWNAQSLSPPLTVPAMASLLTGVPVSKHRVNHEWETYDFSRSFLRAPTMFDYLDLAGGVDTALFIMDERFYQLARPEIYVDMQTCGKAKPQCTPAILVEYIKDYLKKVTSEGGFNFRIFTVPGLLVAHLPEPADVATKRGWASRQYTTSLRTVDTAVADVLEIYQHYGVLDNTTVIVTGLNGGEARQASKVNRAVGANGQRQTVVPWIAWGANVKPGHEISDPVSIMDTGATVLEALGLNTYTEWDSRALADIFQTVPERRTTGNETFAP